MRQYKLPQTKYGMHNLLVDLAIALDDVYVGGQDWDVREDNLEAMAEAEKVLLGDWEKYDDPKQQLPAGYENLPYKVEDQDAPL